MKKSNLVIPIICYLLAFISIFIVFLVSITPNLYMFASTKIILFIISVVFMYFGGFYYSKKVNNNKLMKVNLWIFFILYLILLVSFTLFDEEFNRSISFIFTAPKDSVKYYLENQVNLTPFKTIISYFDAFNQALNTRTLLLNLYGNFIVCMPLSLFLVLLFKKQNKIWVFIITIILTVLGIEVFQLVTLSGSFDIDDIILNLSGAIIFYFVLKIKSVKGLIRNIFLLEHNKINIKELILVFVGVLLFLVISFIFIRKTAVNLAFDYDEYNRLHNPSVSFKYSDECSDNNLFYEDEVYKYYFECYGNDDFYLIVNNEEKYYVKDFLDSSKYNYDIDMLLSTMDYNNIKYKVENKYPHFNMKVKNTFGSAYYGPSDVDSDIAKLVLKDKSVDVNNLEFEVNIIPKKSGEEVMNVDFEIYEDGETKTITKKVKVTVDEDLNVTYKEE